MFEGFNDWRVQLGDLAFKVIKGGDGPAVVLLHGYPQTHLIWRHIAPLMAKSMSVVCLDLKGYGDSAAPTPLPDASNYSKRQMASEVAEIMTMLGFDRFSIIGHDRGARVAYRLALDFPARVERLIVLDILPTGAYWESADRRFALGTFHWGFLAQPAGLPERLIGGNPDFWVDWIVHHWAGDMAPFTEEVMSEYRRCFRRPEVIAATCADYRAGATIDDAHDRADLRQGRMIECPVLTLWSGTFVDEHQDAMKIWGRWAKKVQGERVQSGHFIPEEIPVEVFTRARQFLLGQ